MVVYYKTLDGNKMHPNLLSLSHVIQKKIWKEKKNALWCHDKWWL